MVGISTAAGLLTLVLVWRSHFGPARISAALAVAAMIAGWAVAQHPRFLPGLTVREAAAGRSALIAVVVGVAVGAIVLVPSLILLFRLFLRGRLDTGPGPGLPALDVRDSTPKDRPRRVGALAVVCLLIGVGVTVLADPGWVTAVGIACLGVGAVSAFALAATAPEDERASEVDVGSDRGGA